MFENNPFVFEHYDNVRIAYSSYFLLLQHSRPPPYISRETEHEGPLVTV